MRLPITRNVEEQEQLIDKMDNNFVEIIWLGGSNLSGRWKWFATGEVIMDMFWKHDQPNNRGGSENYLESTRAFNFFKAFNSWNDNHCNTTRSTMCESLRSVLESDKSLWCYLHYKK